MSVILDSSSKSSAEVYIFRFNKGWDWAIWTLSEETGAVSLISTYGNSGYLWPFKSRGEISLKKFLSNDRHYVANKLASMNPEFKDILDEDETKKRFLEALEEEKEKLEEEQYGMLLDELDDFNFSTEESLFYDFNDSELYSIINYPDVSDMVCRKHCANYQALVDFIIPAFQEVLKKELNELLSTVSSQTE